MRTHIIIRLVIGLSLLFFFEEVFSINKSKNDSLCNIDYFRQKKLGFTYDFAITSENMLYEYETYKPQLFQIVYSIPLSKKLKRKFYSINIIPQINSALVTNKFKEMYDFEFGTNFEFSYNYVVNQNIALFTAIGIGPHYISHDRGRQAGGFLFSDNFIVGLRYKFDDDTEIKLHFKFRHMSNANMKLPNWGINNFFIGGTFFKKINF
ncbi:MAG: hypothetical protein A2046_15240 [Bacteroidetes bacterium GWA2_30_7]|nr:MAG: hypothetical protein A2046_15240 [Bacteroidetes bacterium GWA2_30_7]